MKLLKVAVRISPYNQKEKHLDKCRRKCRKTSIPTGWKVSHQYHITHNDVGEVINSVFQVTVQSRLNIDIAHLPVSHMLGVLGEALDNITSGRHVDRPTIDQSTTF